MFRYFTIEFPKTQKFLKTFPHAGTELVGCANKDLGEQWGSSLDVCGLASSYILWFSILCHFISFIWLSSLSLKSRKLKLMQIQTTIYNSVDRTTDIYDNIWGCPAIKSESVLPSILRWDMFGGKLSSIFRRLCSLSVNWLPVTFLFSKVLETLKLKQWNSKVA